MGLLRKGKAGKKEVYKTSGEIACVRNVEST